MRNLRGITIAAAAAALTACSSMGPGKSPIAGNWKVTKFELEFQDTGERRDVFGKAPIGWILLTPEGRAMSYLEAENRKPPTSDPDRLAAFRTLVAYTGKYRVEGDRFITSVDGSWNVVWTGTEQSREYRLDGDRLHILTQWNPAPAYANRVTRGILTCERER